MAKRFGPTHPRGVTWKGAGACAIVSQSRQLKRSRTVWITFHECGTTSRVSVTSCPSLDRRGLPPQAPGGGAGATTRPRRGGAGGGGGDGRRGGGGAGGR